MALKLNASSYLQTLSRVGLKAPVRTRIRSDIWAAVGNLAFNPTQRTCNLENICQYPLTRELAQNMMMEAQTIAERLGVEIGTLEQRINGAEKAWLTRPQCCKILKQAVRPRLLGGCRTGRLDEYPNSSY